MSKNPKSEDKPNQAQAETLKRVSEAYSLAAALLASDAKLIVGLYILVVGPSIFGSIADSLTPAHQLLLTFVERNTQLIFFYIIATKWIRTLSVKQPAVSAGRLAAFMVYGLAFWLLFSVPAVLVLLNIPAQIKFFAVLAFLPAIYFGLKFYFYFFPVLLGNRSAVEIFKIAGEYTSRDWLLPFKAMLAPIGLTAMFVALAMIPSPDGRDLGFVVIASCMEGIFWLLSCYIALAFCLKLTSDKEWHDAGLDPYREARFATLELRRPDWLRNALRPRSGFLALGVGLLVWSGVMANATKMPPSVQIEISKVEIQGKLVTLHLSLYDPRYSFRGFRPFNFSLAGKSGNMVAQTQVPLWTPDQNNQDVLIAFPTGKVRGELVLEFEADRSGNQLTSLEDLYLWYRRAQISWIDMSKALIVPEPGAASDAQSASPLPSTESADSSKVDTGN